ncbi:MAG: 50S ribosomal protein L2 [Candidatus Hadarchaeota archaeon]
MGKHTRSRRMGDSAPTYRAKSWRRLGEVKLLDEGEAAVMDILHDPGRVAPVARVRYRDGHERLVLAPEGIKLGDKITAGISAEIKSGNTLALAEIPEGTQIHNIESMPGDGGKFVRSSGASAVLIAHDLGRATVQMPSGEIKEFDPRCRATVGVVSGGGHGEKPFIKAGKRVHVMLGKGKPYPRVRGVAMNVVDHPFGGGRGKHAGRPKTPPRGAPPGQKVGLIAARRTGKR